MIQPLAFSPILATGIRPPNITITRVSIHSGTTIAASPLNNHNVVTVVTMLPSGPIFNAFGRLEARPLPP
jgi:hypothetical protein